MASVEKSYSDALFTLIAEENFDKSASSDKAAFEAVLAELQAVQSVIKELPDFVKLLGTPTISADEKLGLVKEAFEGKISHNVYNFVRVIVENSRMDCFARISRSFRASYNERFDIAEISVTSSQPLTAEMRGKITEKMSGVTGKTVSINEKVDKSLIGGVVIDYGNTRYDGSVKTRLNELKKNLSQIIV
jgi:F-type H+-transporting ATPase subunit delta